MREIKLKAFFDGKIYDVVWVRYAEPWDYLLYIDTADNWRIYNPTSLDNIDDIMLFQYTWLKDKNWKEIYEWDIILVFRKKNPVAIEDIIINWYVVMEEWIYMLCNKEQWYYRPLREHNKEKEILWNIWVNPELINV